MQSGRDPQSREREEERERGRGRSVRGERTRGDISEGGIITETGHALSDAS